MPEKTDFIYRNGLAVMRCQPFHIGQARILGRMLDECENAYVLLGSIQEHGTKENPLNFTMRKKMIRNVYKDHPRYAHLRILGIQDINNPIEWPEYVLDFFATAVEEAPNLDVYYAGSDYDAKWFQHAFKNIVVTDRTDQDFPYVSGTMLREMIRFRDKRWKNFVHPVNHELIEDYFYNRKENTH